MRICELIIALLAGVAGLALLIMDPPAPDFPPQTTQEDRAGTRDR